jgi:hypothetical protein
MNQTKITVKICNRLLRAFNQDIDRLFLKRDAFLNQMIATETEYLAQDLAGKRLSSRAKRHIAGELKRLGTTPVNVVVDKEVANALNAVVNETNIVRDAFINRMLWLLRGGEAMLDGLNLPKFINASEFESFTPEAMPTAPLKAMRAFQLDPLHYLRVGCEDRHDTGLYLLDLPPKLTGFACWLDDFLVPGTASYLDAATLLAEMDAMEAEAFSNFDGHSPTGDGAQS